MKHLRFEIVALGCLLALYLAVFGRGQVARAHAEYERSEPAADAVIPAAPAEVQIWFSQELFRREGANVIEVSGPDGTQVDQGDTRIDDDDRTHVIVSLQPELPAGVYTVRWRNLSIDDGHEGSGEFSFTVDPAAGEASPQTGATAQLPAAETPTPTLTLSPTPAPPASPTSAPAPAPPASSGLPCLSGFLLGGMFLAVLAAGQRRRGLN